MGLFDRFRRRPRESSVPANDSTPMRGDVGPEVVDFLFSSMGVDARWSLREARSFSWWGHRFAQRVWADPSQISLGSEVVRVHTTTAVLKGIPDSIELQSKLAVLNRLASLSALIWSKDGDRLSLHASATFHAENVGWLKSLFLAVAGIQVADAHLKADALAKILGGEVDASSHPHSGPRALPDEILTVIGTTFAPAGARPSPFTEEDFRAAAEMTPRPWVMVFSDASGVGGQLPFSGSTPAGIGNALETALLDIRADQRHPQLGSGALLTLKLPIDFNEREASSAACALNQMETSELVGPHALGAWTTAPTAPGQPPALAYCCFLPASIYKPGLVAAMAMAMAVRTRWVAGLYLRDKGAGFIRGRGPSV